MYLYWPHHWLTERSSTFQAGPHHTPRFWDGSPPQESPQTAPVCSLDPRSRPISHHQHDIIGLTLVPTVSLSHGMWLLAWLKLRLLIMMNLLWTESRGQMKRRESVKAHVELWCSNFQACVWMINSFYSNPQPQSKNWLYWKNGLFDHDKHRWN